MPCPPGHTVASDLLTVSQPGEQPTTKEMKIREELTMRVINIAAMTAVSWLSATIAIATNANAQETKHYRFAHDQQLNSGYSVAYDTLSAKLKELSKGTMLVDQYPGAQLGQEPQLLQLVKSGDLDFAIVSSANTATISPQ